MLNARVTATSVLAVAVSMLVLAACGGGGGGTDTGAATAPPETTETEAPPETTEPETGAEGGGGDVAAGEQVFVAQGCGSCHTLAAAEATGSVGPNLDEVLPGKDESFIHESIVDPEAEIASGFAGGIMPGNYGSALSEEELDDLVAFLHEEAGK